MSFDDHKNELSPQEPWSEHDLKLARTLGEYVDRFAEDGFVDFGEFLSNHPDVLPELTAELEMLVEVGLIVEEREPSFTIGDFSIVRLLGRGGMGIVYEARQISLDRRVALKVLPVGYAADSKSVARFQREARVAAHLHHANIVGVYTTGVWENTPYYAMELVRGETLQQIQRRLRGGLSFALLQHEDANTLDTLGTVTALFSSDRASLLETRRTPPPPEKSTPGDEDSDGSGNEFQSLQRAYYLSVAEAFAGAAEGLQHAHSNGVVHRDLKPSNLILDSSGRLRILDFGLAWMEGQTTLTLPKERLGTLPYMSPEQVEGESSQLGSATDIYSLGATLYDMLAGRPPLIGRNQTETLYKIKKHDPPSLRRLNPRVPKDLETIVLKCLRKDQRKRYGTAEALAQDLRRFVRGDAVEARPQSFPEIVWRLAWRYRKELAGTAIACVLLLGTALFVRTEMDAAEGQRDKEFTRDLNSAIMDLLEPDLFTFPPRVSLLAHERVPVIRPDGTFEAAGDRGGREGFFSAAGVAFYAGLSLGEVAPGSVAQALQQLERIAKAHPRKPAAHYYLARALVLSDRLPEARQAIARALAIDPDYPPAVALRSYLLRKEGDPRKAAAEVEKADLQGKLAQAWLTGFEAELEEDWPRAVKAYDDLGTDWSRGELQGLELEMQLGRGIAHLKMRELDEAIEDFGACHEIDEERLEPVLLLGKVYCLKGNERAERIFRESFEKAEDGNKVKVALWAFAAYREAENSQAALKWLDRAGRGSTSLRLRAGFLSALGRHDDALAAAAEAVKPDPDDIDARLVLGNAYMGRGTPADLEEAAAQYRRAAEAPSNDVRPLVSLGACLAAQGRVTDAEILIRSALKLKPRLGQAHHALGTVLQQQGRLEEAKESYRLAVKFDRNDGIARNSLGVLADKEGKPEEALEHYEAAVLLAPGVNIIHYNLAWALQRQQRFDRAVDEYREARRLGLEHLHLDYNLGVCLIYLNRFREAIIAMDAVLEAEPGHHQALHDRGVAYELQGNYPAALPDYEKCVSLAGGWAKAREALADMLEAMGRRKEATAQRREIIKLDSKNVYAFNDLASSYLRDRGPSLAGEELAAEIRLFEDAALLPNASVSITSLLESCRTTLLPDVASYASIDWLVERPETLVPEEGPWRFLQGTSEPPGEWTRLEFDDSEWQLGPGGIGSVEDPAVRTRLDGMPGGSGLLYSRLRFVAPGRKDVRKLVLTARAKDGYVAYVNGKEVARRRSGAPGETTVRATSKEGESWVQRTVDVDPDILVEGENILAIQGNPHSNAKDPSFFLAAGLKTTQLPGGELQERAARRLEAYRALPGLEVAPEKLAYFEARTLQAGAEYAKAAVRFREVLARDTSRPEPFARLAECLEATGDAAGAEAVLREALGECSSKADGLWDAWLRLCFGGLQLSAEEVLGRIPPPDRARAKGRAADIVWAIERLAAREPLRINCGGHACKDREGGNWDSDKLWMGGLQYYFGRLNTLLGSRARPDEVYYTTRWFPSETPVIHAYAIPVPRGDYLVKLHFIEGGTPDYPTTGETGRFDVLLEGKPTLLDYEPVRDSGLGVPDPRDFTVTVTDGMLDIDVRPLVLGEGAPGFAAIEVAPVPR